MNTKDTETLTEKLLNQKDLILTCEELSSSDGTMVFVEQQLKGNNLTMTFKDDVHSVSIVYGIEDEHVSATKIEVVPLTEAKTIGSEMEVTIKNFIKDVTYNAKVDTGADICSMHATNIKIHNDTVKFNIDNSLISMVLADKITVKQASGEEERAIIKLTLSINDKDHFDIDCSLSNREHMNHKFLIGKNLLSVGDFVVDVSD